MGTSARAFRAGVGVFRFEWALAAGGPFDGAVEHHGFGKFLSRGGAERAGEEEALGAVAAQCGEHLALVAPLDAFGDGGTGAGRGPTR
jgi:hypothetical protein